MIANAERSKAAGEQVTVAAIPIADQIAGCVPPATSFRELIGDPLGGRVWRYAKPEVLTTAVPHNQKAIQ